MKLQMLAYRGIVLHCLLLAPQFAMASKVASVQLNDQQPYQTIQVTDERYEPIYENQDYQATCDRQVISHYETRCHTTFETRCSGGGTSCSGGGTVCTTSNDRVCNSHGCTTVPRRSCHQSSGSCHSEPQHCSQYPRESCSQHPVYRTEYYSCIKTRTVKVGDRLVKTFKNEIMIGLADSEVFKGSQVNIQASINESHVSVALQSAFTAAGLSAEIKTISQSEASNVVTSKIAVQIAPKVMGESINKILEASIADLKLGYSAVTMTIKNGAQLFNLLDLDMKLGQDKRVISDRMKFDGRVDKNAITQSTEGQDLKISIDLSKLDAHLKSKKHNLSVSASLTDMNIINKGDFSAAFQKSVDQKAEGVYPQ